MIKLSLFAQKNIENRRKQPFLVVLGGTVIHIYAAIGALSEDAVSESIFSMSIP